MSAILSIDAAWTATEPSGVALVVQEDRGWRCINVAPSYEEFIGQANGRETDWSSRSFRGTWPDVPRLIDAASALTTAPIELVAVDMPVGTRPFSARRVADNAISTEFGSRWCSTHSPSEGRPGRLGAQLSAAFRAAGYPLATAKMTDIVPSLIEVYPHPALLSLLKRTRRVPYKVSKSRKYWPGLGIRERIAALHAEHSAMYAALTSVFGPIDLVLPPVEQVPTLARLKRYEDALDALVCAWVGVEHLAGRTVALGDEMAAIWCPCDVVTSNTDSNLGDGTN